MSIVAFASLLLWWAVINELSKPSKKHNNRKIVFLTSLSAFSTLLITFSLIKNLLF